MRAPGLFFFIFLILAIWALVEVYKDAFQMTVNKCDRYCLSYHQYPKITVGTGFPLWSCGCTGHRMPDNYLRKK